MSYTSTYLTRQSSINRNILECKYFKKVDDPMNHVVLIETYWNVKYHRSQKQGFTGHVLIETYWNVKLEDYREIRAMQCGINRNILECKGRIRMVWPYGCLVLIETYWNVKTLPPDQSWRLPRINRNILECKAVSAAFPCNAYFSINRNILECKVAWIKL